MLLWLIRARYEAVQVSVEHGKKGRVQKEAEEEVASSLFRWETAGKRLQTSSKKKRKPFTPN